MRTLPLRTLWSRNSVRTAVAAATCAAALSAPGMGSSAGALTSDPIRYEAREGNELVYEHTVPMAGTDGGTVVTPTECSLVAWCTVVPIEIVPPPGERGELDDWIVDVAVSWPNSEVETGLAGSADSNDIDIYMYHQAQAVDEEGNPEYDENGDPVMEETETGRSASGNVPELLKLYRPEARHYQLVVINFVGVTPSFTVKMTYFDARYVADPLFEDTGATAAPPAAAPDFDPPRSPDVSPSFSPPVAVPEAPAAPALAPLDVDDFGFTAPADFDAQLEANDGPIRGSLFEEVDLGPPEPVSGSTVALWMGLIPLALLAAVAGILFKYRPAALSFTVPRRPA